VAESVKEGAPGLEIPSAPASPASHVMGGYPKARAAITSLHSTVLTRGCCPITGYPPWSRHTLCIWQRLEGPRRLSEYEDRALLAQLSSGSLWHQVQPGFVLLTFPPSLQPPSDLQQPSGRHLRAHCQFQRTLHPASSILCVMSHHTAICGQVRHRPRAGSAPAPPRAQQVSAPQPPPQEHPGRRRRVKTGWAFEAFQGYLGNSLDLPKAGIQQHSSSGAKGRKAIYKL